MPNFKVFPYKVGSKSARSLADALECKILRQNSTYSGAASVINWGASEIPPDVLQNCTVLNTPDRVANAVNKLRFFEMCQDVTPPFLTDPEEVKARVADGEAWMARTLLRASGGRGIVILDENTVDIPAAELYTKYIPKKEEYRIHIMRDHVFDIQKKIKDPEGPPVTDWRIRNHESGFIFVRGTARPNNAVTRAARIALARCNLDFGAVDVIWNEYHEKAYVLEINTAPGLEGQTVENYAEAFRNYG